jgi:TolA-binding protein
MLELAELEAAAGHHDKAAELLAALRQASQGNKNLADDVRERGLYRLAVSDFELGKHAEAAKHAEAFISEFPKSDLIPSAHLFAGEAQFKLEHWQEAADHFAVIVSKHDKDDGCATAMLRLGECQAQLSRWPESEQTFAGYLERFSDSELWFQAQFGLGWARENRGLHDQAIEAYRKVIDRHSGQTAARSQFQIGECLFAQKKHAEAVRELLKVDILYGYPEWSAAALYEAGRCFQEMDQPEQARSQFQQVREKYPDTQWAKLAAERLAANPTSGTDGASDSR